MLPFLLTDSNSDAQTLTPPSTHKKEEKTERRRKGRMKIEGKEGKKEERI